ncbi:MAG: hypothetical protein EBU59_06985 [Planctomycetia bacterium]|nr:hypothetical protein [Planctomycetia bacterium]
MPAPGLSPRHRPGKLPYVFLLVFSSMVAWVPPCTWAEDAPPAEDLHPELQRLSPEANVWLDLAGRRVIVAGQVALAEGPIEFFACPRETKEHESVVVVDASARLVHAALLAIGLTPGAPASFSTTYQPATGDPVAIEVRWQDGTSQRHTAAQNWVRDSCTGEQLASNWVFAGSQFWKDPQSGIEYYQADGGDLVCVSNFPAAMLDLPIASSDANEALLFEVFTERVPSRGTPVELVFSKALTKK